MRWVRSRIRFGTRCALFALAVQFVLLSGHVHRVETAWAFGFLPVTALVACGPSVAAPIASATPSKTSGLASDYCASCSAASLANLIVRATAPVLPLAVVVTSIRFRTKFDVAFAVSAHLLFEARAPPLA
jgi:hypothetical protein